MLRAVLAVALAAALVGAALPAVERGRVDAADRLVHGELRAIERGAESLLDADEVGPGAGARRSLTVELPAGSWRAAGVDYVSIRGVRRSPGQGVTTVAYRIDGRPERRVTLAVPLSVGEEPLVLGDGSHRLVLELTERDGRRVVVVTRG